MSLYLVILLLTSSSALIECITALPTSLPIESKDLYVPPLISVAEVLRDGMRSNFAEVTVEVVECPDLTQEPFTLASKGLGGNPKIVELGGDSNLLPVPHKDKIYDFKDIANLVGSNPAFIIGAGAGPFPYVGVNSEGIYNLNISDGTVNQQSRVAKLDENKHFEQVSLPNTESHLAFLGNFLVTEGKPGPVIKVHVKRRIGEDTLMTTIRKSLENGYQDKNVGMGGVFVLMEGEAYQHVMGDFSETPIETDEQMNEWMKYFNMSAPLIALGTVMNNADMDLDLKDEHFHSFSHHGEAGHFHYDITPDTVEYLGYFTLGEKVYRIDRPTNTTHNWGSV